MARIFSKNKLLSVGAEEITGGQLDRYMILEADGERYIYEPIGTDKYVLRNVIDKKTGKSVIQAPL